MYSHLVMVFMSMGLAGLILIIAHLLSSKGAASEGYLSPFECGFLSLEEGRSPFSMQFFLVSLVFLVFDVELVLLFPYLTMCQYKLSSSYVFVFMLVLIVLTMGLVWEWGKCMLEWQK